MSQENVELVRQVYSESALGDFSRIDGLADDFELVTTAENPDAGTYRGAEARRWMRTWVESFEEFTMEAVDIIDAGDKVVVALLQRGRPRGSQTAVEGRWWQVLTLRDADLARIETYASSEEAFEAAGLRP